MCISSGKADLEKTTIYVGTHNNGEEIRHVLAYQNVAINLSDKNFNSMILAIPGRDIKVHNTEKYGSFLTQLKKHTKSYMPVSRGLSFPKGINFNQVGMYKIGIADSGKDLRNLVNSSGYDLEISDSLAEFYAEVYSEYSIVMAVWEGNKKMDSQPILIDYRPDSKNYLFIPGMDAHTGEAPITGKPVKRDHIIFVGYDSEAITDKYYGYNIPNIEWNGIQVPEMIKRGVHRVEIDGPYSPTGDANYNGDWLIKLDDGLVGANYTYPEINYDMYNMQINNWDNSLHPQKEEEPRRYDGWA